MAYNTTVITTPTGKKIYYKGSYGEWDENPDIPVEEETEAEVPADVVPPTESKKSKVLIFGALIAAALFFFK